MKQPTQEELETMRDARTASLIRRWLAGKKLTDEEKIEVSQRASIPLDILILGPSNPGAKEAVQRAQNTRKHAKYQKKLPEYAAFYGKTERTIKRMIKRGKETGKLPPLDDPPAMAPWWRENMDHEVPDYLLGFAEKSGAPDHSGKSGDEQRQSGSDRSGNDASGDKGPRDFSQIKSLNIEQNVEALRQTHAVNKHLLDEALKDGNSTEQTIALRQRNYERTMKLLRDAETSLIEIKKAMGGLVDPEPIRAEVAQLLESFRLMRETMPRRILVALEQILPRRFHRVLRLFEKFLTPAIEKARADEENIFRNLEALKGPEDVQKLLAA